MVDYKSKSSLTSEFNMGAKFLEFLSVDVIPEIARSGIEARDNPRFRTIEQYYTRVRELWNQSEAVWSKNESDEVQVILDNIEKNIDFISRKLKKPRMELIREIELAQRIIYNTIRKYNMLVPTAVESNTREEKLRLLRNAFGVTNARINFDNEELPEQ